MVMRKVEMARVEREEKEVTAGERKGEERGSKKAPVRSVWSHSELTTKSPFVASSRPLHFFRWPLFFTTFPSRAHDSPIPSPYV